MKKQADKINLIQKYKQLTAGKDKKQLILMWSTVLVCTLTIIFVCSCIIYTVNLNKTPNTLHTRFDEANQKMTNQKFNSYINSLINKKPAGNQQGTKTAEPEKGNVKETDKTTQKDNASVNKTIYKGVSTTQAAITFDDGYNRKYVEKVLDILKENNIKSTFFIIGKVLDDYPEVWKRAVNEGHQICNHTQSHQILTNMSDEAVQAEISGWETSARRVLGDDYLTRMKKEFPYLRLPGGGGAKSSRILKIAQKNGYKVIGWNVETVSSVINPLKNKKSVSEISDKIEQHVVNNCSGGSIILLHFNQYDMGNIEAIVKGLKNRGFQMKTISQLIK
ncbi:polysaccharide deacetylase family protein [Ruminiclostridium sufflavum]|nr:polysaccharide deacetylase family protein [Ruminiclostridium sufflavum]